MGRWGTDVLALACITGGAIVGSGITAGLFAGASRRATERVVAVCPDYSPRIVIRMSKGDGDSDGDAVSAHARVSTIRTELHTAACDEMQVEMAEVRRRVEEARERAEQVRGEAVFVRIQAAEEREKAEAARERARENAEAARRSLEELKARMESVRAEVERAGGHD